jgi:glycosyltransferase involved in cell wall biosynthesis
MTTTKPVLFVTGHAPTDRVGAFHALHEREGIELALFGGRSLHGTDAQTPSTPGTQIPGAQTPTQTPGAPSTHTPCTQTPGKPSAHPPGALQTPHRRVRQQDLYALAASGDYRAVVLSTGGRVALPAAWAGARRARVPVILWASLWAHPRTPAHLLSYPPLKRLYRSADAVVTYGPHVATYVRARGARNVYVAAQAVDNAFWSDPAVAQPSDARWPGQAEFVLMFAGRGAREKGLRVLIEAWCASGLEAPAAALVLVGVGSHPPWIPAGGAVAHAGIVGFDPVSPVELRNFYAASDVLVLPSIATRKFREPWGLVVNEAMNRALPIIASDAVGAAAGGLVRAGHNGLIVPAGNPQALAEAIKGLAQDGALRRRLGDAGAHDVKDYTYAAWAEGFAQALASVGVSRERG